ncbi:MAG: hypothetical protein FWD60_04715 [Candidatus Azobacteroides sp.]|nr:hypothetical protein [Candidatus Azobacteroides sp.]
MTKKDYINRVLLIMNEAGLMDLAGNFFIGADTAQIDRYIEGSFVDAWRRCVAVMPRAWFGIKDFSNSYNFKDIPSGTGYVVLPPNFYLLVNFKMKGWVKAVYEASIENERTASIQSNEYTRGSQIRPVCTISNKLIENAPKQVLNYYSLPKGLSDHVIEEAIFIPVCKPLNKIELHEELDINQQVIEILAYLSASSVFTLFEKYDIAKALDQKAIEMFPGLKSVRGTNTTVIQ